MHKYKVGDRVKVILLQEEGFARKMPYQSIFAPENYLKERPWLKVVGTTETVVIATKSFVSATPYLMLDIGGRDGNDEGLGFQLDSTYCEEYGMDEQYTDSYGYWVSDAGIEGLVNDYKYTPRKSPWDDGQWCVKTQCRDFAPMAEPNQPDGTFVCRACREDPYRFSIGNFGEND